MTQRMPADDHLYMRLDEVTHYLWDPIGISEYPEGRDEYHSYLPEIYARVKAGDRDKIIEYLRWVECERMGMSFNEERAEFACDVMLRWKDIIDTQSG